MDYNRLKEDIPTVRRLDYTVEYTDGFESGKLYAKLRNLVTLNNFRIDYESDEILNEEFQKRKVIIVPKLEWVNQWMEAHKLDVIFTDVNNWKAIGEDYDYFWNLRTEKDFIKEEAEARLGISNREPTPYTGEFAEQIDEMVEKLKTE